MVDLNLYVEWIQKNQHKRLLKQWEYIITFVEHTKLGKTPVEASGIKIEGENKLLTLIQNSNHNW